MASGQQLHLVTVSLATDMAIEWWQNLGLIIYDALIRMFLA